ncbi:hypothetical protein MRS44_001640 [Fusarium solani]|jgi:hypothetical protein|uniref:uncharacterized protein n=1 Tax=Fusarium solani TaxID=169388 RepID=UPI00230B5EE6|nr:hypothetical protein MRS44_001640 [Fusarium solani]KAJ4236989.1 hypothetical protein NW759_000113 [Fusarium solani]
MSRLLTLAAGLALAAAQLSSTSLENHVDALTLGSSFNPVQEAYWTGFPHHRRTPFAVSPDGKTAYLAYLDASGTGVHVQGVDPKTFAAVGTPVTVKAGEEAGGLVAHNDGFALLTNEVVSGESKDPLPVLYKYTNGKQTFRTLLGGSGLGGDSLASPDINGDLVFSEKAGYYAAYIVVTSYSGSASGHFGDAIRYITTDGKIEEIAGASSSWGCSHNTGIAFEEADAPPFASLCAEDQGAIWLNTETQGMGNNGVKVSNEMTINGGSNEPMGGMGGSYSSLARFIGSDSYIFSWVSRGAIDLTLNDWMGQGYTKAQNRTNNRNVAIALFSDKKTLVGEQATSQVGAADGDSQVNWVTDGANDCSNAHAAAFDASNALVTWEEISNPVCPFEAMGCKGKFAGTKFQLVDSKGKKVGEPISSDDTYVAGDMVTMADGRICWPYVNMAWSLDGPTQGSDVTKISFACVSNGAGSGSGSGSTPASSAAASQPAATKSAAASSAKPSAVKSTPAAVEPTSVQAVEESTQESATVPEGAPRPSFAPVSQDVTNVLPEPTNGAASSAAAEEPTSVAVEEPSSVVIKPSDIAVEEPSSVVIKPSQPAATTAPDAEAPVATESAAPETGDDEDCDEEPSSVAITPSQPAATDAESPVATESAAPETGDDEDCDEEPVSEAVGATTEAAQAPSATQVPTGTRTRKTRPTRRPRPSGYPWGSGNQVNSQCSTKTVTHTVYVTATAAPSF